MKFSHFSPVIRGKRTFRHSVENAVVVELQLLLEEERQRAGLHLGKRDAAPVISHRKRQSSCVDFPHSSGGSLATTSQKTNPPKKMRTLPADWDWPLRSKLRIEPHRRASSLRSRHNAAPATWSQSHHTQPFWAKTRQARAVADRQEGRNAVPQQPSKESARKRPFLVKNQKT